MIKGMATLLRRTNNLDERIKSIEGKENQAEIEEYNEEQFVFPFQTEEQLFDFEKKLENTTFYKKMVSYKIKINYKSFLLVLKNKESVYETTFIHALGTL